MTREGKDAAVPGSAQRCRVTSHRNISAQKSVLRTSPALFPSSCSLGASLWLELLGLVTGHSLMSLQC